MAQSLALCPRRKPTVVIAMASATTAETSNKQPWDDLLNNSKQCIQQVIDIVQKQRYEFLNSSLARLVTISLLFPIDAMKTRVQVSSRTTRAALSAIPNTKYGGLIVALLGQLPHGIISFTLFTMIQKQLIPPTVETNKNKRRKKKNEDENPNDNNNNRMKTLLAACLADGITSIFTSKTELMKIRIQSGMSSTITKAFSEGSLMNGYISQIVRDIPFRVFYLILFSNLQQKLNDKNHSNNRVNNMLMASGVGASIAALTTPMDVIRSRMMAQHVRSGSQLYKNWIHCFSETVKREGITGLYRGMLPRSVYMAASIACFMFTYDQVSKMTSKQEENMKIARNNK